MSEKKKCTCDNHEYGCCKGNCCEKHHGKCSHTKAKANTVKPFPAWSDPCESTDETQLCANHDWPIEDASNVFNVDTEGNQGEKLPPDAWYN